MPLPATAEEVLNLVRDSRLVSEDLLATYRGQWTVGRADPQAVLARLVADHWLTHFQARRLTTGVARGFFLGGKYKLLDHLGTGGMGRVYLCEHLLLHRLVAVKVLQVSPTSTANGTLERFLREAQAVARIDHPNVTRVFDMDCSGPAPFMVMEHVDGRDLHTVVTKHGPLVVPRVGHYAHQAAHGLAQAHRAGLVHRDIKPANLLLDRNGTVKILDLGLARFHEDVSRNNNLTGRYDDHNIIGTADFIAPEQTVDSSAVDIRADIYSLGCTVYFLLTGRSPFEHGNFTQKLLWHQLRPPTPVGDMRPDVPADLRAVVGRMMAKDPADRYQTPTELAAALSAYAGPILPPPADEMPSVSASAYRLGMTPLPVPRGDTKLTMSLLPDTAEGEMPASAVIDTPAGGETAVKSPRSEDEPDRPAGSRRRRWIVFGLVQMFVLSLGVLAAWLIDKNSRPATSSPPARPFPVVPAGPVQTVAAGGSTLIQNLMRRWTELYAPAGGRLEYAGGGSTHGYDGLLERRFDFACTDAYLTAAQLERGRGQGMDLVHIPLVHGAVVPVYNLGDVGHGLQFSGAVLADIYLGRIRKWNDPQLARDNPQAALHDLDIRVVYRLDGSGSTRIWTDFLWKTSAAWRADMGDAATTAMWPAGEGAPGGDGVAELVGATRGAIGYVDLTQALTRPKLSIGAVRNRHGVAVQPTQAGVRAAAAAELRRQFPKDFQLNLTDGPGADAYPIAGTTWAVFDAADADRDRRDRVLDFLDWATHAGQAPAVLVHYAPLPDELVLMVEAKLQRIRAAR